MPTHHRARSHASRDASSRASTTKRRHDFFPITPGASHRPRPPPSAPHRHHPPTPIARARPPRRVASIRRAAFARAASTDADPDAHRIASHRIASRTFKHRPLIAAEADIANMANGGSRVTSSDDARARRGEGRGGEARRRSRRRSMNRMHRSMNRPIDRCVDRSIDASIDRSGGALPSDAWTRVLFYVQFNDRSDKDVLEGTRAPSR